MFASDRLGGSARALTLTRAMPCVVGSALLVAVSCTVAGALTFGAVKSPVAVIVPAEDAHVTSALLALDTWAANWWVPPAGNAKLAGETSTCTGDFVVWAELTLMANLLRPCALPVLSPTEIMNA